MTALSDVDQRHTDNLGQNRTIPQHVLVHLADHSRISKLVRRSVEQDDQTLLVAGDNNDVWIIPASSTHACFHCFELWRFSPSTLNRAVKSASMETLTWSGLPSSQRAFVETAIATYPLSDLETVTYSRHCDLTARTVTDRQLLRHPLCEICGVTGAFHKAALSADAFQLPNQPAGARAFDLKQLRKFCLEKVLNAEHGIVKSITRQGGSRIIPVASAEGYGFAGPASATWSFGRTGDCNTDWIVASLEAVERLAGMKPGVGQVWEHASYSELGDKAADPNSFILPEPPAENDENSVFERYSPTKRYDWCEGFSVTYNKPVLVPLQLAYYGLARTEHNGSLFVDANSNGCALGGSILEAAFHGLLELLERDAFLRHYYADAVVPSILPEALDCPFIDGLANRIQSEGYELDFLLLSTGTLAHAIAARLRHQDSTCGPALAFAAGADLSLIGAARAAVCEVASNIFDISRETLAEKRRRGLELLNSPNDVSSMEDHGLQGWPSEALDSRDFRSRASSCSIPDVKEISLQEAFQSITQSLAESGVEVIVVDQSHPSLIKDGIHCVNVLASGLLPMTFGHQRKRVSAKALSRLPLNDAKTSEPEHVRPHLFQ